ncbi:MAG: hypothetical protein JXR64_02110 [Spirochaetales bacterium]|nr:hypothetical protein [Spirochaetales bacterium]
MKIVFLSIVALLLSCSIVELEELLVTSNIDVYDYMLPQSEDIFIEFSLDVDKDSTQKMFSITKYLTNEVIEVDYKWESNTKLVIIPVIKLDQGARYKISGIGNITLKNGNEHKVNFLESFYFIEKVEEKLEITQFSPQTNSSIDVYKNLEFNFNIPADPKEFESEFSISPALDVDFNWSNDYCYLSITPKTKWDIYTLYKWKYLEDKGNFLTQSNLIKPVVEELSWGKFINNEFQSYSQNLNGLEYNSALKIKFNNPIDEKSFLSSFSIEPTIDGEFLQYSSSTWIFNPSEFWEQKQEYKLIISKELQDIYGNYILEDYSTYFNPVITPISIKKIGINNNIDPGIVITDFAETMPKKVLIGNPPGSDLYITIELESTGILETNYKEILLSSISLNGDFPKTTIPQLTLVNWISKTKLLLHYEGLLSGGSNPWDSQTYLLNIQKGDFIDEEYNIIFYTTFTIL